MVLVSLLRHSLLKPCAPSHYKTLHPPSPHSPLQIKLLSSLTHFIKHMVPATGGARRSRHEPPFKGIRMRKWGKWVAEVREPNKRSRIWLGSYSTPLAAARAYDIAVYFLRGPTAKLNFPEEVVAAGVGLKDLSADSIRRRAAEIGAQVDAMVNGGGLVRPVTVGRNGHRMRNNVRNVIDLNKKPEPEYE